MPINWLIAFAVSAYCMLQTEATSAPAQLAGEQKLARAIKTLRNIHPEKLSEKEQREKSAEMDEAWKTITLMGNVGLARVKQEVQNLESSGEKDEFFRLDAAHLAWTMGSTNQAEFIAHIWKSTDLSYQYDYVFLPAFQAAGTQNASVIPMLKSLLGDERGNYYVIPHSMLLKWPRTLEFVWGRYGSAGLPALLEVLKTSDDPVALKSAAILVGESQYLPALPELRRLAKSDKPGAREFAIEWIGDFGHPDDFEFLASGLKSKEPALLAAHIRGLTAYDDLRAAPLLIPFLDNEDKEISSLAAAALASLMTPQSLKALHDYGKRSTKTTHFNIKKLVDSILEAMHLTWEEFEKKEPREQRALLQKYDRREEQYRLRSDDKKISRKQLTKAFAAWKKAHRITGGDFEWVESRHVLAVAKPDDLNEIIDVRAAVYGRLSDECLYEVETLNDLIRRLGRSRYRKIVGVCEHAEPLDQPTSRP